MNRMLAALLSLTFFAAPRGARRAADAANGKTLAERWCATCHVVSPVQKQATTQAPPFSEVAKRPHIDAPMVAFYLMAPHPTHAGHESYAQRGGGSGGLYRQPEVIPFIPA